MGKAASRFHPRLRHGRVRHLPSSLASKWCGWEVERAVERGKRILPVLCRPLDGKSPPSQLAALQNIYFYREPKFPGSGFGKGLTDLAAALTIDRNWLREGTRYLRLATEWEEVGKPSDRRLLSAADIALTRKWVAAQPDKAALPTALQLDFIKASEGEDARRRDVEAKRLKDIADAQTREAEAQRREAEAQREAEQARRVVWRTRLGLAAALVLLLVASGLALFASQQRNKTEEQRKLAEQATATATIDRDNALEAKKVADEQRDRAQLLESRALAILSQEASKAGDQPTAMLLALEALPQPGFGGNRPLSSEAAAALDQAWMRNQETRLLRLQNALYSASFSANGTHAVTTSGDKTARVWDLRGERRSFVALEGHQGSVNDASFTVDGTHVVTTSEDATARVWDLRGERPSFVALEGHKGEAFASFSADVTHVVTTSLDKTARVWDLRGERPSFVALEGHQDVVNSASFSADGTHVVTASDDKTARVWDLRGERPSFVALEGHQGRVISASFNADGTHVVTASEDATARVWDLRGEQPSFVALEGIKMWSFPPRSASTEPMSSHVGGLHGGCGICAASNPASSPSKAIRVRSTPSSAPTDPMSSPRPTTGRRGCGTCAASGQT